MQVIAEPGFLLTHSKKKLFSFLSFDPLEIHTEALVNVFIAFFF